MGGKEEGNVGGKGKGKEKAKNLRQKNSCFLNGGNRGIFDAPKEGNNDSSRQKGGKSMRTVSCWGRYGRKGPKFLLCTSGEKKANERGPNA